MPFISPTAAHLYAEKHGLLQTAAPRHRHHLAAREVQLLQQGQRSQRGQLSAVQVIAGGPQAAQRLEAIQPAAAVLTAQGRQRIACRWQKHDWAGGQA